MADSLDLPQPPKRDDGVMAWIAYACQVFNYEPSITQEFTTLMHSLYNPAANIKDNYWTYNYFLNNDFSQTSQKRSFDFDLSTGDITDVIKHSLHPTWNYNVNENPWFGVTALGNCNPYGIATGSDGTWIKQSWTSQGDYNMAELKTQIYAVNGDGHGTTWQAGVCLYIPISSAKGKVMLRGPTGVFSGGVEILSKFWLNGDTTIHDYEDTGGTFSRIKGAIVTMKFQFDDNEVHTISGNWIGNNSSNYREFGTGDRGFNARGTGVAIIPEDVKILKANFSVFMTGMYHMFTS